MGGGFRKLPPRDAYCLQAESPWIKLLKPWFASPVGCPVKPSRQGQMGRWCPAAQQSCKIGHLSGGRKIGKNLLPLEGICELGREMSFVLDQKIPPAFTQ